jgi:formylglycine-generating enzyme required for sulfatase activity
VTLSAFEVLATEVTQAQYEAVTGDNPSAHTSCPTCPVEQVNYYLAKGFCEAVGGRLLSEAEWEYAARAGTTSAHTCGDDPSCLDAIAWYAGNSGLQSNEVALKTPNAFGLYDMLGNVWTWTEDCWNADYSGAPTDGSVWAAGDCTRRVIRGGSYTISGTNLRVSYRTWSLPDYGTGVDGVLCAR